jgi:AraC-like DNA-binding protein
MQMRLHQPGPALSPFVEHLWSLRDAPVHARERIVPSGTLELVFNLVEDEFRIYAPGVNRSLPGAMVSGCYGTPFDFDTRAHASVIGVHFKPGGAARLLGVPPGELADSHVSFETLWGPDGLRLRERLGAAPGAQRFQLLQQALEARLKAARAPHPMIAHALRALEGTRVEIGHVSDELGLSKRRFIEIFSADVGMTPKRYARVRRFQRALALATASHAPGWAEIAQRCGYFDQAHLCRDWAELTGLSPSGFVALRREPVKDGHLALAEGVNSFQDAARPGSHAANHEAHSTHALRSRGERARRAERQLHEARRSADDSV